MQRDAGIVVTAGDRGHLQRDFKSYCRGDFSRTRQGRAITRYASFVAFNKAYSMDVNKHVHCVRTGQFTTRPLHRRDDCKLSGRGAALKPVTRPIFVGRLLSPIKIDLSVSADKPCHTST